MADFAVLIADDPESATSWPVQINQWPIKTLQMTLEEIVALPAVADRFDMILVITNDINRGSRLYRTLRPRFQGPILLLTFATQENKLLMGYRVGFDECIEGSVPSSVLRAKLYAWYRRVTLAHV